MPAVSVLKRRSPRWTGVAPAACNHSTSSAEKSPSGPTASQASARLDCQFGQATLPGTLDNMLSQWATAPSMAFKCGCRSNTSSRGQASCSKGIQGLWHCLVADTTTLDQRTCLSVRRSLRRVHTGTISLTPNSVAFSINHSNRSVCLVGATTRLNPEGRFSERDTSSTCTEA